MGSVGICALRSVGACFKRLSKQISDLILIFTPLILSHTLFCCHQGSLCRRPQPGHDWWQDTQECSGWGMSGTNLILLSRNLWQPNRESGSIGLMRIEIYIIQP